MPERAVVVQGAYQGIDSRGSHIQVSPYLLLCAAGVLIDVLEHTELTEGQLGLPN